MRVGGGFWGELTLLAVFLGFCFKVTIAHFGNYRV